MRTVRDDEGTEYVLLKQSSESSLLRNAETGEQTHLPNESFEAVEGESPLSTTARRVPTAVRTLLSAVRDDRSLGLLLDIEDRGPMPVRTLMASYDLCESDFHGIVTEFRAAGLLEETTISGERGYQTTELGSEALAVLTAE